jgi:hypothetical protein
MAASPAHRPLRLGALAALLMAVALVVPPGLVGPPSAVSHGLPGLLPMPRASCRLCHVVNVVAAEPSTATDDWQNVTPEQFGDLPPATEGASMAYDVADHGAVWFGGCGANGCASNETWLYRNSSWTNETANLTVAPRPRSGAMMDYDPNARAVVLFGGHVEGPGVGNQLANDTWEFANGVWSEQSSPCAVNSPACLNPSSDGSFAFDANRSVNSSVLFGGCYAFLSCTAFENETWWFNGTAGRWLLESGFPSVGAPSARVGAAMAYDPRLQGLVLFGGTARCGSANCTESDTWTYAAGNWTNVTATIGGTPPPGRVFGSFTWDPALNAMLLSGGRGSPSGPPSNSTYFLTCDSPGAACDWSGPLGIAGTGLTRAAVASNSSGLDPMFVGGESATGVVTNATWVYSALPHLNVAVAPAPQEVGQPVYLNASAPDSVDPEFRFLWGDGTSVQSPTGDLVHEFPTAGAYNATIAVVDPNGSANVDYLQLLVHPGPEATIIVSYPGVDVGVRDTFTAAPVLGTGTTPYNVTWNFGSGAVEFGASVYHTFFTPGNVSVTASIVDALGLPASASVNVSVAPVPTVSIVPQFSAGGRAVADSGVSTTLLAKVVGGTAPYNFTWQFGDGGVGFGLGPTHTYGAAPVVRTVSVTLVDAGGATVAGTTNVSVAPTPVVTGISTSPSLPTAGATVAFAVATSGGVAGGSFLWTFGDGSTGSGANATHSYGAAGTYTVTAWWNDSAGGSASRSLNVTVGPSVSALAGFLLNPIVLTLIIVLAAATTALVVRSRQKPPTADVPPADPAPPPESAASPTSKP